MSDLCLQFANVNMCHMSAQLNSNQCCISYRNIHFFRSRRSLMFFKIGALKNFEGLELYYKETPAQVFPCEYYEIFKNNFFYRTPPVAASVHRMLLRMFYLYRNLSIDLPLNSIDYFVDINSTEFSQNVFIEIS